MQLLEGRTGAYAGWHPPVMSWLLGLVDWVRPGTAVFVFANALVLFAAVLSLLWLTPRVSWLAVPVVALCVISPQFFLYQGIVWKDVLFANAAVAGFVALAHAAAHWSRRPWRYGLLAAGWALLVVAALARQNGLVLLPFAAGAMAWCATHSGESRRSAIVQAGAALCAALAVLTVANLAFATRTVGDAGLKKQLRWLAFYDLNGALAGQPNLKLPPLEQAHPDIVGVMRSDGRKLYSPIRSDFLARPMRLQKAFNSATGPVLRASWLHYIAARPALYLHNRVDIFRWLVLTPDVDACAPYIVGVSGPPQAMAKLGLQPRYSENDEQLDDYGTWLEGTPAFSHVPFLILALGELAFLVLRHRSADIVFACMITAMIVFGLSFFFISIACDYRYLYPLDLGALTTLIYIALDPRIRRPSKTSVTRIERPAPQEIVEI
ncbi:MAG TPA: hypothetical protein VGG69_09870 [Rhizomicrobium sp.]